MRAAMIVLALALVGCGRKSTPPGPSATAAGDAAVVDAPLDRDLARLVARGLELFHAIGAALETANGDCAVATRLLEDLAAQYADVTAANDKIMREGREVELKAALQAHEAALSAAAQKLMTSKTMATCAQDPAFGAAFEAIVTPRAEAPAPPSSPAR